MQTARVNPHDRGDNLLKVLGVLISVETALAVPEVNATLPDRKAATAL